MRFVFEQIRTGGDRNFGYLLGDREAKVAALIDPSYAPEELCERAKAQGMEVLYILNTHGHHDHTNGNEKVIELTGAELVQGASELGLGGFHLDILPTPGHTSDHVTIFEPHFKVALTGDHLFVGKVGGTKTEAQARQQWDSLHLVLAELPPETTIWPGHDYGCRPSSTLVIEQATNPFLLCPNFEAFCTLKAEWLEYKKSLGLK